MWDSGAYVVVRNDGFIGFRAALRKRHAELGFRGVWTPAFFFFNPQQVREMLAKDYTSSLPEDVAYFFGLLRGKWGPRETKECVPHMRRQAFIAFIEVDLPRMLVRYAVVV